MDKILKYFPDLTDKQREQLSMLGDLYKEWNAKINVVSRKGGIENLYTDHVLHSLSVARMLEPVDGTTILDLGTGGGFPGIPLAIVWPQCRLHLIDRIGKKIRVVNEVAAAIGLQNVTTQHGDVGECHERFDFVVSRAVMRLDGLVPLVRKNISRRCRNKYDNGLICLKGGDIEQEIDEVKGYPAIPYPVEEFIPEPRFADKYIVYVPMALREK